MRDKPSPPDLEFANPGHILPTLEGKVTGIVGYEEGAGPRGRPLCTTQCAVCFTTATGATFSAVQHIKFTPDEEFHAALKYRRCRECRAQKKHPSN